VGPAFPSATDTRPPEIGIWMKNRRLWKDISILDKEKFSGQWWNWWISLQPEPRAHSDRNNIALLTVEMDWSKLQKPGKNGFLLVMISLVWWGKVSDMDGGWLKAVIDVIAVLRCMQESNPASTSSIVKKTSKQDPTNTAGTVKSKWGHEGDGIEEGSSKKRPRMRRSGLARAS
jgi:hypothetical protein